MFRESLANETIELEAGEWTDYRIDAQEGDTLHYVLRESFGSNFDIYLVHEENVAEHAYWTEHSLVKREKRTYYRGRHNLRAAGVYFVVISNERAKSVSREIYIKLEIEHPTRMSDAKKPRPQDLTGSMGRIKIIDDWKLPIAVILATIILSAAVFGTIPGLSYIVTFGGGALLTMYYAYRRESNNDS